MNKTKTIFLNCYVYTKVSSDFLNNNGKTGTTRGIRTWKGEDFLISVMDDEKENKIEEIKEKIKSKKEEVSDDLFKEMEYALDQILGQREYDIRDSTIDCNGDYCELSLEVEVPEDVDEDELQNQIEKIVGQWRTREILWTIRGLQEEGQEDEIHLPDGSFFKIVRYREPNRFLVDYCKSNPEDECETLCNCTEGLCWEGNIDSIVEGTPEEITDAISEKIREVGQ